MVPFQTKKVQYFSGNFKISARLFFPNKKNTFPAIIISPGSGKPGTDFFSDYINKFISLGIAVFVPDKKGLGDSSGNYLFDNFQNLAEDLIAGFTFLKEKPEIISSQIGVLGYSQGVWVCLIAAQKIKPSFYLIISGPMVSPLKQTQFSLRNALKREGFGDKTINHILELHQKLIAFFLNPFGEEELIDFIEQKKQNHPPFSKALKQGFLNSLLNSFNDFRVSGKIETIKLDPWVRSFQYEPLTDLKKIKIPIFFNFGEIDPIINVSESVKKIYKIKGKNLKFKIYQKANHHIKILKKNNKSMEYPKTFWENISNFVSTNFLK